MPGKSFPSKNSSEAPPPVEMWVNLSSTLNLATAAAESPPPTMVITFFKVAKYLAMSFVPSA